MGLVVVHHALIKEKITRLRDKNTSSLDFRQTLDEISQLLGYRVFEKLDLKQITVSTPLQETKGYALADEIVIVPILRAGLGMVDGLWRLVPEAKIAHVGLYRDENTLKPHSYFEKHPKSDDHSFAVIVDPILATGNSLIFAIERVKAWGFKKMCLMVLLASPEGVKNVLDHYPDLTIYTACLDESLNEKGYVVPGLGDAGDRIFGTK